MIPSQLTPKERPILFTAELREAILDGRKTETRRIVKGGSVPVAGARAVTMPGEPSPYGRAGDLLHVGESLVPMIYNDRKVASYERDGAFVLEDGDLVPWRWKVRKLTAMYCPKAYRRIWLRVTEVGTELLSAMPEADAIAEGAESLEDFRALWDKINAKRGFPWESNPLVWVVRFDLASTTGRPATESER